MISPGSSLRHSSVLIWIFVIQGCTGFTATLPGQESYRVVVASLDPFTQYAYCPTGERITEIEKIGPALLAADQNQSGYFQLRHVATRCSFEEFSD